MNIQFPSDGGIKGLVYWLLEQIMGWGWIGYGFAIVFFTLFIKLMLAPLDFLNRFLTRRTQLKQQALAGELADLEKIYKNEPMELARARQALYQKNGVGGLGSGLVGLATVILTMVIFFQVMGALSTVSNYNIQIQYQELQTTYRTYLDEKTGYTADSETDRATVYHAYIENMTEEERVQVDAELTKLLNDKYNATKISFGWIKNIWQPDSPLSNPIKSVDDYNKSQSGQYKLSTDADKEEYAAIYSFIDTDQKVNGYFILAILSAVTVFLSLKINGLMAKRNAPKKAAAKAAEPIITYSLRDAKAQGTNEAPMVDPAQMTRIMQWMMPILYVFFATMQTSAFAIYMISSSIISTLLSVGFSFLIDAILKNMKRPEVKKEFDAAVINPHAKYFKGGKKWINLWQLVLKPWTKPLPKVVLN